MDTRFTGSVLLQYVVRIKDMFIVGNVRISPASSYMHTLIWIKSMVTILLVQGWNSASVGMLKRFGRMENNKQKEIFDFYTIKLEELDNGIHK